MNIHPLSFLVITLAGMSHSPSHAPDESLPEYTPAEITAAYNVIASGAQVAVQAKDCVTAAAYLDVFSALSLQYPAPEQVKQYLTKVRAACPPDPVIRQFEHAFRRGNIKHHQVQLLLQMEGLTDEQLGGLELMILKQKDLFNPNQANGNELRQWKNMQREMAQP